MIFKNILGVIAGYAIFVVSALALFKLSKQDPHADPTTIMLILAAVYGALFSFLAGYCTHLISRARDLKINYVLALVIAGFALFSLIKSGGNHWSQLLAIFIFAPVSILGGKLHLKRSIK